MYAEAMGGQYMVFYLTEWDYRCPERIERGRKNMGDEDKRQACDMNEIWTIQMSGLVLSLPAT